MGLRALDIWSEDPGLPFMSHTCCGPPLQCCELRSVCWGSYLTKGSGEALRPHGPSVKALELFLDLGLACV